MPAPRKVSEAQLEQIIRWMEQHPLLALGAMPKNHRGREMTQQFWEELTAILNAVDVGAKKTIKGWREYWSDLKCKVRKKKPALSQHPAESETDGSPAHDVLTPSAMRILNIMEAQDVVGDNSVPIPFKLEETSLTADSIFIPLESPPPPPQPLAPSLHTPPYIPPVQMAPEPAVVFTSPVRPQKRKKVAAEEGVITTLAKTICRMSKTQSSPDGDAAIENTQIHRLHRDLWSFEERRLAAERARRRLAALREQLAAVREQLAVGREQLAVGGGAASGAEGTAAG